MQRRAHESRVRAAHLFGAVALIVMGLLFGCRADENGNETEEPTEDVEYFCDGYSSNWCTAFRICDEDRFNQSFRSFTECSEQVENDCLDPPEGLVPCRGVTREEADGCTDYLRGSIPDDCNNLFGHGADMSPCEDICD